MRRNLLVQALCLLFTINAQALIVNVNGQGEIPEEGMELTIAEAEQDPLTGQMLMELQGDLLSNGNLTVTISRSANGLADEFCCADQCTSGNGETAEVLSFSPDGIASWFTHYAPQPNSQVTVTYRFEDSAESRTLTVHYNYEAQAVENVNSESNSTKKVIQDGILYIIKDNKKYTIQ